MARSRWTGTRPGAFGGVVKKDFVKQRNRIVADGLQLVVMGSPVDQGTFRANHRVSEGGPDTSYDLDAGKGRGAEPSKGAFANVESYRQGMIIAATLSAPFTQVFITNSLPYAERIEDGHSGQAGSGVYGIAANNLREKYGR